MPTINLHLGDNRDILPTLGINWTDSIVCDPPYELGFMGRAWDSSGIAYDIEMWKLCYAALKPGGYLLAFGGSRTYHRLACAIEDAGFDIRDQIMWVYGSGFPKSMDISKQFDKSAGVEREVVGKYQPPNGKEWNLTADDATPGYSGSLGKRSDSLKITSPTTDLAKQWDGWGTALKPAHEPIVVARKPFPGTVIENVTQWGTAGLNIDACRVEFINEDDLKSATFGTRNDIRGGNFNNGTRPTDEINIEANAKGRWPANLIHDGSEEVISAFDSFGTKSSGKPSGQKKAGNNVYGEYGTGIDITGYGDSGSAARFFYCAKADKADRNEGCKQLPDRKAGMNSNTSGQHITRRDEAYKPAPVKNNHPTVKPVALMQYLSRLVTPSGGMVLDPFMGSGSTGKGAIKEGFGFTGIELLPDHYAIAQARINHAAAKYKPQITIF